MQSPQDTDKREINEMTLVCFICKKKFDQESNQVSYTSRYGDGIIQLCNDCYGVVFE